MLQHKVRRLGRFGKAESFKKCSEVGRWIEWTGKLVETLPTKANDRSLMALAGFNYFFR
jgi:hypothetical protein